MVANYSPNPTNPANQSANPAENAAPANPAARTGPEPPSNPRNIRDYIALARSRGDTPSFTNVPGGAGFDIRQDPAMVQQAIPEEPQNEYEKMPFAQRMKINPYLRAKQRIPTMLPELWQAMFPDMPQGGQLSPEQHKNWSGAVEAMTGNLLKQYDKQYDWSLKNSEQSKAKRSKDEQFWQKFYASAELKQQLPTDPETGRVLTPQEFIDKQMSIADERKFRDEMAKQADVEDAQMASFEELGAEEISAIIQKNPDLGAALKEKVMASLSQMVGAQGGISDGDFMAMRQDPQWKGTFGEEVRKAIIEMQDAIMQFANRKPTQQAIPEQ